VNCRECADFLMRYLDDELEGEPRATFEYHLSRCRNCVEYIEQYRRTIAEGRAAFAGGDADLPDEVPEELIQAILAARRRDA
jgi:anti-sigma factor RsiW